MTKETSERIRQALEADLGRAQDNACRARAQSRGITTAANEALRREYEREEADALAALKEFDPAWAPQKAFSRP